MIFVKQKYYYLVIKILNFCEGRTDDFLSATKGQLIKILKL
jgi:hypothetical protein